VRTPPDPPFDLHDIAYCGKLIMSKDNAYMAKPDTGHIRPHSTFLAKSSERGRPDWVRCLPRLLRMDSPGPLGSVAQMDRDLPFKQSDAGSYPARPTICTLFNLVLCSGHG
jgi:hypothetical protein